jgi:glyoxylase-like metal-dependent hydrolase (beta-lactamase superfamily II)
MQLPGRILAALLLPVLAPIAFAESWCDAPPSAELADLKVMDVGDEWFKVYQIVPDVFAIAEPRQAEGVNSFLIVGQKRAVLFDSGLGVAPISKVVQQLTSLPVTVVNSHTHFDHVGGNSDFSDVRNLDIPYSQASARGQVDEALATYARPTLSEDNVCGKLPSAITSRDYTLPTWHASGTIRDGEQFDLGGRSLEIVRTPGHTPDSICLLDRANGLLFTGDTYYSGQIYLWAPGTDVSAYNESIDRLVLLEPQLKRLMPAHGVPTAEPQRLVELKKALQDIRSGAAKSTPESENRRLYRFARFEILMAPAAMR